MARLDQESFELIAEAIPHIVWLADANGSTDYFNGIGTDYTGFPRQSNYGWQWLELVHGDDMARAQLGWEHATRSATPFELSYRIRRNDGEFRWHAFRALPVRGPAGDVIRWIGTADDVEEVPRVDHEARIERQVAELSAMLEVAQPAPNERFGFVDAERRVTRVNDAMASAGDRPRPGEDDVIIDQLTGRDVAVARLVASGYTNTEIANVLALSLRSIEGTRARLRRILGVRTRAQLVRFTLESGLQDREL